MDKVSVAAEYRNRTLAEVAKGALEARGIAARISADDLGGLRPALSFIQGVQVLVSEENLEEAIAILESSGDQETDG